jgi:group II intron reverse transcriptase/maturase
MYPFHIRLELSSPGSQFITDNQLYNSIITAHAVLMSAPMHPIPRELGWLVTHTGRCIKDQQAGKFKPYEETQTVKLLGKAVERVNSGTQGATADLFCPTSRITNLKRNDRHNGTIAESENRTITLLTPILSLVLVLPNESRRIATQSGIKIYARDLRQTARTGDFGITYGNSQRTPVISHTRTNTGVFNGAYYNNYFNGRDYNVSPIRVPNNTTKSGRLVNSIGGKRRLINSGDGGGIVQGAIPGSPPVSSWLAGSLVLKAGFSASRGSDTIKLQDHQKVKINIKNISNLKNLITAYELIKSNPGNMTPGPDGTTLDGTTMEYLIRVQEKLEAGTFKFSPARRVQIPKPGKKETRPLGIASPREKLVQKAMQLILEPYFEAIFKESSHGFRPNKSVRTAIKYLDSNFQSSHYIIEADFSKAFDTVNHALLMEKLKDHIQCEKTLALIKSSLKAGYVELNKPVLNPKVGTPQGSILSPLLCNVYLHSLDTFVEELKEEFERGSHRKNSPEYTSLQNKAKYWRKKGYDKARNKEYRLILNQLIATPSRPRDGSFIRIQYVRYADDFIVGIEGNYQVAQEILERIRKFVEEELLLKFNPDKTGITKYSTKHVKFLGYNLMAPHMRKAIKPLETITVNGRQITRRKKIRIRFNMDLKKVLNRLTSRKIIRLRTSHSNHKEKIYRGRFIGNLINLDHPDIIRYYNSVIRGIYNFYDFVNNRNNVLWVVWLIKESCALTLARKFKLRTMSKTFAKFGFNLAYVVNRGKEDEKKVAIIDPKDLAPGNLGKAGTTASDPLIAIEKVWNAKFTKTNLNQVCLICGNQAKVEMHHVRKIRDLKDRKSNLDFYTRQMAAINRKQIPLCKAHHTGLHNDSWTEQEKQIYIDKTSKRKKKA